MEALYAENLLPRIIMTITCLALAIGPAIADFNKTHATNPLWPPHARFHVVWQVITNSSLNLLMLYILWVPMVEQYNLQLVLVALVQGIILFPLFITTALMPLFDGTLADENGLRPFKFNIGGKKIEVDTNLFNFTIMFIGVIIAFCCINHSLPSA